MTTSRAASVLLFLAALWRIGAQPENITFVAFPDAGNKACR